jgi:gluconolactonase
MKVDKSMSPLMLAIWVALAGWTGSASSQQAKELPDSIGEIVWHKKGFEKLVPKGSKIEVLAGGFEWSEGPVYIPTQNEILFSDIPNNMIVRWKIGEKGKTTTFLKPSGYTGKEKFTGTEPGTNGLMLGPKGTLFMCCHGDRCIKKMVDGKAVVVADRFEGKRFNSPNDLAFHNSGDLYFTDPPYGLPKRMEDPSRELDWCGVYRYSKGKITLLTKEMTRPNGIAFSPDYKTLYVAQSDPEAAIWKAFPVKEDGTLGKSKVLYDATEWVGKEKGLPDGMDVDSKGRLWATGPGGVLVFRKKGKLIGQLNTKEATANCTFGNDGYLYITADMYFCRVKTTAVSGR